MSPGGAGIKAAQLIVDENVQAVLTPRCGENAAQVLQAAGIALYKTNGTSLEENIRSFVQGELLLLDKIHAGLSHHGEIDLKIAVLSGKGGTGKTFVSVNLAAAAESAVYVDCDVEEPNGHLFFRPNQLAEETVAVQVPAVDPELCTGCRKCVEFCRYGALAHNGSTLMIFANICHSCGGCVLVCPEKALAERDKPIGKVQRGYPGVYSACQGS